MTPENKSHFKSERDLTRAKIDEEIRQIQSTQFTPLQSELVEIVATVATNGRMLKDIDAIKNKADEIDAQDDPISILFKKRYGSLASRYENTKRRRLKIANLYGWRGYSQPKLQAEHDLKKMIQETELQINVAKELKPEDLDPEKIFTSIEWWKSSLLLEKIIWNDDPFKPRKIVDVPVNKKFI